MKSFVVNSLSLLTSLSLFAVEPAPAITNLLLNDRVPVEVPVGLRNVTTITFPMPVQALDGSGITSDGKTPGAFQLAYEPTNAFLALQALVPGATGNLNVRLGNRTYVLLLSESKAPVLAMNFRSAGSGQRGASDFAAPPMTPTQLLGLLDKARNYEALKQHHPDAVDDVTKANPSSVTDYDAFAITLEEVYRFDQADALVFKVTLASKTQREVRFRAGSWAIRVGERLYPQALGDSAGSIPASGAITNWFVIQGSPDGRRNNLSPHNRFIVLVNPR